jgi:pyruvate dehydrogenase E2 component (dihydrolipoamide acetyltransferase)
MAEVIRMPRMSDTMEEGNIVSWLKEEGDEVESGELLAEVETDKATMELDSFFDGVLLHIAVKEGPVPINGIIAVIGEKGEDWQAAIADAQGTESSANGSTQEATEEKETESAAPEAPVAEVASADDSQRIKASPLAKSMAKDAGIDIATIKGTGDNGRIIKRDVEAHLEQQSAAPTPAPVAAPQPAVSAPHLQLQLLLKKKDLKLLHSLTVEVVITLKKSPSRRCEKLLRAG